MNKAITGAILIFAVVGASCCAVQKSTKVTGEPGVQDITTEKANVRVEFFKHPPKFSDAELEIVRRTRETISHYFWNPNDFYISSIVITGNGIRVKVDRLEGLQTDYELVFASKGANSRTATVAIDDSFRPIYFEFNPNYELQKCVNNWNQECKPLW